MHRLRKFQATIVAATSQLTASQKLLVGTVLVLMLMILFLVQLYTGKAEMVPLLPGKPLAEQGDAVAFLQANSVEFTEGISGVMVPAKDRQTILAQLSQGGALGGDNTILFDSLIDKQSWTMSQQQNRQLEVIAVQNELAAIVGHMSGIQNARVILHLPASRSLGQPASAPSASITVFPTSPINQQTVDAIAHLVASSRGIDPQRISIVDGSTNRRFKVRDDESFMASSHLELQSQTESHTRDKIAGMLSYIPDVRVTVRAQVDVTRRTTTSNRVYNDGDGSASLVRRETSSETKDHQGGRGGEPGPRSNVAQDISGLSGGQGSTSEQTTSETEFEPKYGGVTTQIVDPRGTAMKINAIINIPRTYFAAIWKGAQGDVEGEAEPGDADLQPIVDRETARIRGEVEDLIDTSGMPNAERGDVKVSMIPIASAASVLPELAAQAGPLAVGDGGGLFELQPMVKTMALGGLAVVALGLVVFTALRSAKTDSLPTAAELVGVPPALDGAADLVGEAEEADSVLQGIELTDDEMRQRKVIEQVNEMVDEQPADAARLLSRWISGV